MGYLRLLLAVALVCCFMQSIEGRATCRSVVCSSFGYRFRKCYVPFADRITSLSVKKKMSRSACTKGRSFGGGYRQIWVNKGCRALFNVCYARAPRVKILTCSSLKYRPARCATGLRRITKLVMLRKQSRSRCVRGISYGFRGSYVWVNKGCRATFKAISY